MSDIPDAIGAAATGAGLARAVEPKHGETPLARGHFAEQDCLNCGARLDGHYCKECGQAAHLHRTLGGFLHDLAHGVFHLEGKTWRTLPMLAWRPGELTRDYIDGHRARYVSPMALFLFSVFLMFAVFQVAGISTPTELGPPVQIGKEGSPEEAQEAIEGLKAAREAMGEDNPARPIIDGQIQAIEKQIADDEALARGEKVVIAESGEGKPKITSRLSGVPVIDRGIEKWRENPSLMAYKVQSSAYKFSWLLIPLSLPFVWLIFAWRRRFGLYDHAVFVTYSITFMSLLFVALTLAAEVGIGTAWLATIGTTVPIYHIYRHLRGAYQLSRFSAVWRTVLLIGVVFVVLSLFAGILMLLGTFG